MGNITKAFSEWVKIFFTVLGVIFFVLALLVTFLPWRGGQSIEPVLIVLGIVTASVFSLAHIFIATDYISVKMPLKTRLIISLFPCGVMAGIFSHYVGLSDFLRLYISTYSLNAAILSWVGGLLLSIAVMILVFFFLELRYIKTGKLYDQALRAYKESM